MAVTYRKVSTNDGGGLSERARGQSPEDESAPDTSSNAVRSQSERIADKLHALAWVVVAYGISSYTHLFHTVLTDERILRPILHASIVLFSINIVLTIYLTVYLPFKFPVTSTHKTPASSPAFWEVYCPRVIPTMTAFGVIGSFLLVRACYPVW
eukprot:CAMPEP_0183731054 /NCGR_PEP_ID=MMETSP0737-20130205/34259_1 /TAXON_ID=385413 /ORGANISM="Thalassiosira miniscula, Strain CCMP1093" /LENGTH=153 /DNA_ID=CAMNT_0025963689 /DNA_START=13 /DNA_END=471 /DNA_ORIENTATION=+